MSSENFGLASVAALDFPVVVAACLLVKQDEVEAPSFRDRVFGADVDVHLHFVASKFAVGEHPLSVLLAKS